MRAFRTRRCWTVFMKSRTESRDGILMVALNEEDMLRGSGLVDGLTLVRFEYGHGIHTEKPKAFVLWGPS